MLTSRCVHGLGLANLDRVADVMGSGTDIEAKQPLGVSHID